jgi:zinc transport system ATP-binding protein
MKPPSQRTPVTSVPAIETSDLSFAYEGGESVLRDVDLRIAQGEMIGIVGPNGGGKTTLLKLLLGLLSPDRGEIRVLGLSPSQARPQVGYVPQHLQFDPRFPVTAWDVVLMGRLGRAPALGPYRRDDRRAAEAALEQVGLAPLRRRAFAEMSGGQRQRALIARALVTQPRLLLLDEPTASLDLGMEQEFYDLLARLAGSMTVAIVSHDVGFVSSRIGTVVCVRGQVAVHATEALSGEMLRELYGSEVSLVQHHDEFRTGSPHPRKEAPRD